MESKYIHVVMYGGEPLLELSTVEHLIRKIGEISQRNAKQCSVMMVTNGYLLTRNVAERLSKVGLHHVQVTLDGPEKVHDSRRVLKSGQPTFNVIQINIREILKNKILRNGITIRINAESAWLDQAVEIADMYNNMEGATSYIAPTMHHGCDNTSIIKDVGSIGRTSPGVNEEHVRINYCSAVALESIVIMPDGSTYRCTKEIHSDIESYGYIDFLKRNTDRYLQWVEWPDKEMRNQCSNCKYKPLCSGTCKYDHDGFVCNEENKVRIRSIASNAVLRAIGADSDQKNEPLKSIRILADRENDTVCSPSCS